MFLVRQVGWDAEMRFASELIAPQYEQALLNVLAVLRESLAARRSTSAA